MRRCFPVIISQFWESVTDINRIVAILYIIYLMHFMKLVQDLNSYVIFIYFEGIFVFFSSFLYQNSVVDQNKLTGVPVSVSPYSV